MSRIRILIANKYFLMNYAITCILQNIEGFEVFGTSEDGILSEIEKFKPDILLVEVDIIKTGSYKLLSEIKENFPELKIIVLLDLGDEEKLFHILKFKLDGYLLKNISREELIHAANCVFKGEKYFSKEYHSYVLEHLAGRDNNKTNGFSEALSEREKEIMQLIVTGINNAEIAGKLYISENTVLTHRRNIMKKLKVKNTAQLILTSLKEGIISIK
jgi:DNA-binding NarL/FixJ family response regulator